MESTNQLNYWTYNQRIIHHIMLKTIPCKDLGLLYGRMGIAITFYLLSAKSDNKIYSDYAGGLLDVVIDKLYKNFSTNFESGLSGIGWGFEFLIQNNFIEANSLTVCEDIDKAIIDKDVRRITDYSLENGLSGLLHYILIHIKGCLAQGNKLPFDKIYLMDLYYKAKSVKSENTEFSNFIKFIETGTIEYEISLNNISHKLKKFSATKLHQYPLGIQKGLASIII